MNKKRLWTLEYEKSTKAGGVEGACYSTFRVEIPIESLPLALQMAQSLFPQVKDAELKKAESKSLLPKPSYGEQPA
jgi:hypothetical protein